MKERGIESVQNKMAYPCLVFAIWLNFCRCAQADVNDTVMMGVVPDEQRLYQTLMFGYDHDVRPVVNVSETVIVSINVRLNQLIDLDERRQVLITNVFIDQTWRDLSLTWDPELYNSLQSIRIPSARVWLPDTFMFNNADEGSTGFIQGKYVLVEYDGKVTWPVPTKLKSSCKVDMKYFPFDDQLCSLRFGSWVYSGRWVDFVAADNNTALDLSSYVNNSEWDLLHVSRKKVMRPQPYSDEPHAHVTYRLYMRRRTFFYIFNVIIPCTMLSVLTMLTFWLPPVSSEKVTLGLSVFLAFSMFMLLIAEEVPATSESVPLIGLYLCMVMTMTSASVIMAVMVINLYTRGVKRSRAPRSLRILTLDWLSTLFRMRHDISISARNIVLEDEEDGAYACSSHHTGMACIKDDAKHPSANSRLSTISCSSEMRHRNRSFDWTTDEEEEPVWKLRPDVRADDRDPWIPRASFDMRPPTTRSHSECVPMHRPSIRDVSKNCKMATELLDRKHVIVEWQRIALVTDRALFWLFLVTSLVAYVIILVIIPTNKTAVSYEETLD